MTVRYAGYQHIACTRDCDGILEIRMHTLGGPVVFTPDVHRELTEVFYEIGRDRDTRLVIFTGTGESWLAEMDGASFGNFTDPEVWDITFSEGRKLLQNLIDIEVPVIAAVNGPALIHSELILTCDIVLAASHAVFQDQPHLAGGVAPGDGMHVLWPDVLGPTRARYFLLTRQVLSAGEALAYGVVNEVLPPGRLLARARELAAELTKQPTLTLRYTRAVLIQRLRRLLAADLAYGLALEGLTAANLAYRKGPSGA